MMSSNRLRLNTHKAQFRTYQPLDTLDSDNLCGWLDIRFGRLLITIIQIIQKSFITTIPGNGASAKLSIGLGQLFPCIVISFTVRNVWTSSCKQKKKLKMLWFQFMKLFTCALISRSVNLKKPQIHSLK